MLMKHGVKTNVMQMKIALTCGIDRIIKDASCLNLAIWAYMGINGCLEENCLRKNYIEFHQHEFDCQTLVFERNIYFLL